MNLPQKHSTEVAKRYTKRRRRLSLACKVIKAWSKWLASFRKSEPPSSLSQPVQHALNRAEIRTTYNIILEFGEMDLRGYFWERVPPVFSQEIEEFWKALFDVAHTIKTCP